MAILIRQSNARCGRRADIQFGSVSGDVLMAEKTRRNGTIHHGRDKEGSRFWRQIPMDAALSSLFDSDLNMPELLLRFCRIIGPGADILSTASFMEIRKSMEAKRDTVRRQAEHSGNVQTRETRKDQI